MSVFGLTQSNITEILYKKYLGIADSKPGQDPSQDLQNSARQRVIPSLQVFQQSIPSTKPTDLTKDNAYTGSGQRWYSVANPYIVYYSSIVLTPILTYNSYYYIYNTSNILSPAIPFNYDPTGSYAISVYGNNTILIGQYAANPWTFDGDAGVLSFFTPISAAQHPPNATFWRYEGAMGLSSGDSAGFQSTVQGLGSAGYISSTQLISSVHGLEIGINNTSGVSLSTFSTTIGTNMYTQILNFSTGAGCNIAISSIQSDIITLNDANGWVDIGFQRILALSTVQINTGILFANNTYLGTQSTITSIQFYGLGQQGLFNNTAIAEQSTGSGTQELFFFKGSSIQDKIRFQTTGIISFESLVPQTLYNSNTLNPYVSTPSLIIYGSSVGIGISTPIYTLNTNGYGRFSTLIVGNPLGPGISSMGPPTSNFVLSLTTGDAYKPSGGTWNNISDRRMKENIIDANLDICYSNLKDLHLRRFNYTTPMDTIISDKNVLGFIAQEVISTFPKSITMTKAYGHNDFLLLNTDQINMTMYGALQKTIQDKEYLESTVKSLLRRINILEEKI